MSNLKSKMIEKKEIVITKQFYDSIEECQCGGPIFKYKDITNNVYVVKCGYYKKVIEIDKNTKKKLWIVPKKSSCNWKCVCNGEKPIFQEINKGITNFIEKKVSGDIHKQLEEKLRLLFRFLYLANHFITLDEINVLVRNNLLREPRKTFLYPSTTLYITKVDESYEDYEKRIFSKKIIDMSYVNYLKYNKEVITEQIIEPIKINKIKKVNGPKYSLNTLFASKKNKKENNYELFEENENLEPSLSQFIVVDSEHNSDDDSDEVKSDNNSEIDSENEEEQRSDSDNEEYDDKEDKEQEVDSEFESFIDETGDIFDDDEGSEPEYYDD